MYAKSRCIKNLKQVYYKILKDFSVYYNSGYCVIFYKVVLVHKLSEYSQQIKLLKALTLYVKLMQKQIKTSNNIMR